MRVSYADDTSIHFSHRNPHVVKQTINLDLDNATIWFRENGMRANPEKYQAIVLGNTIEALSALMLCAPSNRRPPFS